MGQSSGKKRLQIELGGDQNTIIDYTTTGIEIEAPFAQTSPPAAAEPAPTRRHRRRPRTFSERVLRRIRKADPWLLISLTSILAGLLLAVW